MRLEFRRGPIKDRSFLSPEEIKSRNQDIFGVKVDIGTPLVTRIIVKDPTDKNFKEQGRSQRMIEKTVNLADQFNTVSEQIKALHELEKNRPGFSDDELKRIMEIISKINFDELKEEEKEILEEVVEDVTEDVGLVQLPEIIAGTRVIESRKDILAWTIATWDKTQLGTKTKTKNQPIISVSRTKSGALTSRRVGLGGFSSDNAFIKFVKGRKFNSTYTTFLPDDVIIVNGRLFDAKAEL